MSKPLRQGATNIRIGPFVDSSDGVTPEESLTISQSDILLGKVGGSLTQKADTNSAVHDSGGWYDCALATADTDTLGPMDVSVQVSGAAPYFTTFNVMPTAVYDSLVCNFTSATETNLIIRYG